MQNRAAVGLIAMFLLSTCSPLISIDNEARGGPDALGSNAIPASSSPSNTSSYNITGFQEGSAFTNETLASGPSGICQIIDGEVWCQGRGPYAYPYGAMFGNRSMVENWPDDPDFLGNPPDDDLLYEPYRIDMFPENRHAVSIHGGWNSEYCAVLDDGSVSCWGDGSQWHERAQQIGVSNYTIPSLTLPDSQEIVAMDIGGKWKWERFACALTDRAHDNAYCFPLWDAYGNSTDTNRYGEFGLGYVNASGTMNTTLANHTYQAVDLHGGKAISISVGLRHVCAVVEKSNPFGPTFKTMCWGDNTDGQVGDGTRSTSGLPDPEYASPHPTNASVDALGPTSPMAVSVTDETSCALLQNGDVSCWGGAFESIVDEDGYPRTSTTAYEVQLRNTMTGQAVALHAGATQVCLLSSSGDILCWQRASYTSGGNGTINSTHPDIISLGEDGVEPLTLQGDQMGSHVVPFALMENNTITRFWDGEVNNFPFMSNAFASLQERDSDGDGIPLFRDICPNEAGSLLGCTDADGDGVPSIADVCSGGDDRFDADDDGVPDQCDDDRDGDGILDDDDMFPDDATEWRDLDADGVGDNSDGCPLQAGTSRLDRLGCTDSDGDGTSDPDGSWTVEDGADAFPDDPSESRDSDGDGLGDHADPLPYDPSEWSDNDDDGIGDLSDTDDDNDGVPDSEDDFALDRCASLDTDSDGMPDFVVESCVPNGSSWYVTDLIVDDDDDDDGIPDDVENGGLFTNENCDWQWYPEGVTNEYIGVVWLDTENAGIRHRQPVTYRTEYLYPGHEYGPRSIATCDFSYDAFNDSDGDGKTLGNYFTAGDPGQWNQFGDADECATGHDVLLQSSWTNAPAGYSDIWNRVHRYCSNPLDSTSNDTDGDGISDWDEIHQERDCTPQDHLITFKMVRWGDEYVPERGTICHTNPLVEDTDGDGFSDQQDPFPTDPSQWADGDGDGFGDNPTGYRPDACMEINGNSTVDRWGCLDVDGDGFSNADDDAPAHPNGTADAFPFDASEHEDTDRDGHGDNSDVWPNDRFRWHDTDLDGIDNNSDACPEEAGSSTLDRVGCPDRDGDGVSDRYDDDPDDPDVTFSSEYVDQVIASGSEFYRTGANRCQSYGGSEYAVDYRNDVLAVAYYAKISGSWNVVVERYDRASNAWTKLTVASSPPYNPCNELGNMGDWSNTPAHIELIVDQKRAVHFLVKTSNHRLQYHQWDGDNHRSHTFGHGQLIGGAAMAVDGTHVHITRFVTLDTGGHAMNYEYSANSGITWTEALVKEGRDFKGTAVAASGSTGYFVYTEAHPEDYCAKTGGSYTIDYGGEMRTFQRCEQYLYEPGSGSGIYYMERTDSGFSSAEMVTDSNQADALRNPKIVVDRETGFLFVIAGKANLIEYPCAYRPTAHDCMDYIPDGLYAFIHLGDEWLPYLIGEGHAGSSYDLDITDEGVPQVVYKSSPTTIRYLYLIASETEQSNDGITVPILQGDSISHHITGNIGSGVGLAIYDRSPIFIHTNGSNLVLTSWDDDNDGFGNWEDHCPYAFGLSTDKTQGCPDVDGDGRTDRIEGTEDEDGTGGFGLPSLSVPGTLWMIVGAAMFLGRKRNLDV